MNTNSNIPAPTAGLSSSNLQATAGSRESSEFEFVGNNGSGNGSNSTHPALLQTDETAQKKSDSTPTNHNLPTGNADVLDKSNFQNPEDEGAALPALFGWVKGTGGGLLSKVAEKTKSSVETVITTLDPQLQTQHKQQQIQEGEKPEFLQWFKNRGSNILTTFAQETITTMGSCINTLDQQMKEYIRSGGDITIVVASDKEVKVQPVREAFQKVLGRATIYGIPAKESSTIAEQPVGFAAGRQAALERIQHIRGNKNRSASDNDLIQEDAVVVAIESFLLEVGDDSWVDIGCLILSDVSRGIHLTGYTQPTPVDSKFVAMIKDATPETYPKRWSGYAETIGGVIEKESGISRHDWHQVLSGVARREIILMAGTALAYSYHKALSTKVDEV